MPAYIFSLFVRFKVGAVLRIRIRDPVLFYPLDSGSGIRIRDGFFPDPRSGPFFDEIFLQYLQNPSYVIFITLAYS
jgi:hypothetical protein